MSKEWHKQNGPMRKPPGGFVPLELPDAEGRYAHEPADETAPDKLFERRWASTVIEQVRKKLQAEYVADGKADVFETLQGQWSARVDPGFYTEAARTLSMTEGSIRVALHRLRDRFGQLLRREIEDTVSSPLDVDAELRHLLAAYGG
jgi:RNA polymerase sigma-70 factor (ECF subfamily)